MAGADASKLRLNQEEIFVPENLINGNKFLKWDEDSSSSANPVTCKVDPHGHFLFWKFQNKDVDCLELTQIRDTRTGKYALTPKDSKLSVLCDMGSKDEALEDKTVTVVYGSDFVNLTFINFCATSSKVAQEWCEHLLKLGHNSSSLNPSPAKQLHKIYTKITIMVNREGQIPVKNIRKMFSTGKEGKKVETSLQVAGVHSGKDDTIDPKRFTFDVFFTFYLHLVNQKEVDKLFQEMGAKSRPYLVTDHLVKFLNNHQRDPRLNEILYPFYDAKRASAIIDKFEKNKNFAKKGHMSIEGLIRYLMSDENQIDVLESYLLSHDMDQPLSHYFVKSSHNTYLTGHQLTGRSSVEIYRQVLLSGCRCVELDCWDGKGDTDAEPIITHGYTMCTDVLFKDVIEAINESAFKTSDYPIILSFENHCNQKQQAKMAHYCRTIFGDKLLIDPLSDFPIESGKVGPPPADLRFKILVKNKKRKHSDAAKKRPGKAVKTEEAPESVEQNGDASVVKEGSPSMTPEGKTKSSRTEVRLNGKDPTSSLPRRKISAEEKSGDAVEGEGGDTGNVSKIVDGLDNVEEESDDSDDEEDLSKEEALKKMQELKDRGTAGKEAEAGAEMSALVNYIQPVHFSSFETSDKKNKSYEISSFVETSALNRVKENPVEFVNYNKRQLSRIYPKGTRVDSSNFMPQIFWNCGCQLVALNYQNMDLPMQLNLGLFNQNGRTGYILKPDFMRRKDRHFDPFSESTMDGIVAATVKVKVLSGQFMSEKKVGTYIEVDMFGLPADTIRKKNKTKTISNTTINPHYDDEGFVFEKVIMPKLAMLRITAYDDNNKQIGHRIMPVSTLRPGYRHIPLRNELYQPLLMQSIFVHIEVKDYVPKGLANFADALVNPIRHQTALAEQIRMREDALSKLIEEESESNQEEIPQNTSAPKVDVPGKSDAPAPKAPAPIKPVASDNDLPSSLQADRKASNKPAEDLKQDLENVDSVEAIPQGLKKMSRPSRPSEEIVAATIDDVKQEKRYQKVLTRLDSELQKLVKKHEKKQSKLKKGQVKDLNKFKSSQEKARKKKEKRNSVEEKKSLKSKHGNVEEVKKQITKAMETLQQEQEKELMKKQVSQEDTLIEMYRRHLIEEKELKKEHAEMLFELQMDLMTTVHEKQLKKLDGQHKKVEHDLRKILESKNIEEMKSISKTKREKNEIHRLKREARNKHIEQAVTERTRLIQLHDKKRNALKETMKELQQTLSEDEETMVNEIEGQYKVKIEKMLKERKFRHLASDTNGSVPDTTDPANNAKNSEQGHNGDAKKSNGNGAIGQDDIIEESTSMGGVTATSKDAVKANPSQDASDGKGGNSDVTSPGVVANAKPVALEGAGHVAGEVEIHASIDGAVETNTNNSAQTHSNGDIVTVAVESSHSNGEAVKVVDNSANGDAVMPVSNQDNGDEPAVVGNHANGDAVMAEEGSHANVDAVITVGNSDDGECKDSETGERSKIKDSPCRITAVVESTKL